MVFMKAIYHILAIFKHLFYKAIYGNSLTVGTKTTFRRNFSIMIGKGGFVIIGDNCFFNNDCSINALNEIEIGSGSIFGENVKIYDHNHRFKNNSIPIQEQGYSIGKVQIGRNCWIGSNVTILKNSKIGNNCVIGAGCVISGTIEDGMIVKMINKYDVQEIKN